jgi:NTE family protein
MSRGRTVASSSEPPPLIGGSAGLFSRWVATFRRQYSHTRHCELSFGLFALLAAPVVFGQSGDTGRDAPTVISEPRPRVGLVLAGGGAKGGAHVGVLQVLEEMHVPVDCIAGTSMGALVGGGYASGIPAPQMKAFLEGINWRHVIGGLGRRSLEPIEQKRQGVTYTNNLQMGIKKSRIVLAPGLIDTSAIEDLLRGFVGKARAQTDFDRLPIPYRAVATDMVTGRMVVLDHGDLATAMRASMAIPGAFAPVTTENQILADGGLVRNVPVDVARKMCADIVIVVNLVSPPAKPEELQSPGQLLGRTMDLMIEANERTQLQSLTPRDVRIDVQMGDIGTADFERTPETIKLGETAARDAAPQLARYVVSPAQYVAWRNQVTSDQGIDSRVAAVEFGKLKRVNPGYLNQLAGINPGDAVSAEQISKSAQRMSAVEDIDSVSYELKGDPQNSTLEWLPYEKSWGPDFVKVDLGAYATTSGDNRGFVLYLQHDRTWINSLGAQWRNELQFGTDQVLSTSFYQPLDVAQRFFVEPRVFWDRNWENVFYNGDDIARYQFDDRGGRIDVGMNLGNQAQVRVGYLATQRRVQLETGSPLLPQLRATDAGIAASAILDTRDTPFSPTRGMAAAFQYFDSDEKFGAERKWQRAEIGVGIAVPFYDDVMWLGAAAGSHLGSKLPADRLFALGGPASLPGYQLYELRAAAYWTVSGRYLWQLKDLFALRGQTLYAGLGVQDTRAYDTLDSKNFGQIQSLSFFITGRTPVGPLTVGFATTTENSRSVWISFGRPIEEGTIVSRGIFR